MSLESEASALELLSKTVELMYKEYQAGCPYTELADGLSDRLARLGMFSGDRGTEVLVLASSTLVDRMPKAGRWRAIRAYLLPADMWGIPAHCLLSRYSCPAHALAACMLGEAVHSHQVTPAVDVAYGSVCCDGPAMHICTAVSTGTALLAERDLPRPFDNWHAWGGASLQQE